MGRSSQNALVAVSPGLELSKRPRLFSALEAAMSVVFVDGDKIARNDDVALGLFFESKPSPRPDARVPVTLRVPVEAPADGSVVVEFASSNALPRPLRGVSLSESRRPATAVVVEGGEVLAHADGTALWTRAQASNHAAAFTLEELEAGEQLRGQLQDGRFLSLLPLVCVLRYVLRDEWFSTPLRAAFIFDDPNLHLPSYGFLHFRELARHAEQHGYHAAMAMVPLDAWFAHPEAVRIFRDAPDRLSLLVHGNNHVKRELAGDLSAVKRRILLTQSLRRVNGFERRYGVSVSHVMAPPHGGCSQEMADEMVRVGFEAFVGDHAYPWLAQPPGDRPLADWFPAELVSAGLPVIRRFPFSIRREELVFRALLDQPIVLYGHHDDARCGLDFLAQTAAAVGSLGNVHWLSLDQIARTNFAKRCAGSTMHIRLFSRKVVFAVPEGIEELVVHTADRAGTPGETTVISDGATQTTLSLMSEPVPVRAGSNVEIVLRRPDEIDTACGRPPLARPWPLLRRLLTEGRDRVQPLVQRRHRADY